ncbi:MAG: FRG domain-containing protein [Syntrophotaleaceae bacterium]
MIHTLIYENWNQFKSTFYKDLFSQDLFLSNIFIFRGQSNGDWPLISSFDRWYDKLIYKENRKTIASGLIDYFLNECYDPILLKEISANQDIGIAMAQHYGVPTRLLDWSESPYIAAFFSFIDCLENFEEFDPVSIWALRLDSPIFSSKNARVVKCPKIYNDRLRNQKGLFTLLETEHASINDLVLANSCSASLVRALIPSTEAVHALSDLSAMGITAASLFPDYVGAAIAAKVSMALARIGEHVIGGPTK